MATNPKLGVSAEASGDPSEAATSQVAILLFNYFVVLAVVFAVVGTPFFANKAGALAVLATFAVVASFGKRLVASGRQVLAMHAFAGLAAIAAIFTMATSPKVAGPSLILVMVLPAYAAVCGRRYAYWLIAAFVAAAVAVQVARTAGLSLPTLFPMPTHVEIVLAAVVMIGVVGPLSFAFSRMRDALRDADAEIRRRRAAESELEAAKNDRGAMLNALPDLMFKVDQDGRIKDFHSSALDQLYVAPEDFLGKTLKEVLPPDAAGAILAAMSEAAERGSSRGATYALPMGGATRWFEVSVAPMATTAEPSRHFILLVRDITERKQAEEALAEARAEAARFASEQRLGALLGQSVAGIAETDLDGRLLVVNDRMCELFGGTREELLRSTLRDITLAEDAPLVEASMRSLLEGAPLRTTEERYRRLDGRVLWCLNTAALIYDAAGRPERFNAILFDVTALKTQEQALADAEQRWKFALEGGQQGVWDWDLVSHRVYYSPQYKLMLGYGQDEIGDGEEEWSGRIHPDDLEAALAKVEGHFRGEIPVYDIEFRMRRKDGSYAWISSRGLIVDRDPDGRPRRVIGTHTDITDRKRAELALAEQAQALRVAKEAAEAAAVAKANFLANMSHEIRTPLNAITGLAHLIRKGGLTPGQAARLGRLEGAADHLLEVLNSILDLSKIDAGKFVMDVRPVRIEAVVANAVSMLGARAAEKHLGLFSDVQHLPQNLFGDPMRLQQALLNYINNAIKFTEQGSVTIRAKLVGEDPAHALIRFEVEDTGPGIEPAVVARLFQAFEQAESSTTRKTGGTGLGLAITKRLAELMGGEAGVLSAPGAGSTFWFTARLERRAQATASRDERSTEDAAAILRRDCAGTRILLAEDTEINVEVAKAILEDVGLVVDVAADGVEAVAKATQNGYGLVLMDMQMPRMDGLDATREIRKLRPSASLPIIAMTANAFTEDRENCYAAGMDDFLGKPVTPDRLYEVVLKWLKTSTGRFPASNGHSALPTS